MKMKTIFFVAVLLVSLVVCSGATKKAEGIEPAYSYSRFLCAPDTEMVNLLLPENIVEGSDRGKVSVVGTLQSALIVNDDLDLDVSITPPGLMFHVDADNMQLLQTGVVPLPTDIDITLSGTGCALVQLDVWYNINPDRPDAPVFAIALDVVSTGHCQEKVLDICTWYLHEDGPTNMTLVEVRLVSGWVLDVGSLPQLDQDEGEEEAEEEEGPGVITNIETDNDMVIFYLNKLNDLKTCFKFVVKQELKVDKVKPGHVTVVDYYDRDKTTSQEYTLECPSQEE